MQNFKSLLVLCVAAVCVLALTVRGVDNEAQAKARAALEQKVKELQGASPSATPSASPSASPQQASTETPSVPAVAAEPEAIAKARAALEQKLKELQGASPSASPKASTATPAVPAVVAEQEAIVKAREALRQKMAELQTQSPAPAQVTAVAPATPAAQPATPVAVQPTQPKADSAAIAKAREALRQKMGELQAQQPTVFAEAPAAAPAAKPVGKSVAKAAPAPALFDIPAASNPEAIAKAQAALRQKVAELNAREAAQKPALATAKVEVKKVAALKTGFQPIEGPALPFAADKQQALADLLRKYKVDEITPEEYHQQRAKILAQ